MLGKLGELSAEFAGLDYIDSKRSQSDAFESDTLLGEASSYVSSLATDSFCRKHNCPVDGGLSDRFFLLV